MFWENLSLNSEITHWDVIAPFNNFLSHVSP